MILENYRNAARLAHYWTSFSPDVRGDQTIKEHSEQLEEDLQYIRENGGDPVKYQQDYERYFSDWLSAKSKCASSAVTGPAKFSVKRAEAANNRERSKYNDLTEFRERVHKAIERRQKQEATAAAGGEIGQAKQKLESLTHFHERMKRLNKAHAAYKKNPQSIFTSGLSEEDQQYVINWVPLASYYTRPFEQFELTNNLAKIKSTQSRIKELEAKEVLKGQQQDGKEQRVDFEGGHLLMNYEADRIQIFNDKKPSAEVIAKYKSCGLKWSPSNMCWQRKITGNAIFSIEHYIGIPIRPKKEIAA